MTMEKKRVAVQTSRNHLICTAFETMLNYTADLMFVKNTDLVYVAASMPFVKMVGKQEISDIVGKTDEEIFEDSNLAGRYISDDLKMLRSGVNLSDYIEPLPDENGHHRYGSTAKYIMHDEAGKQLGILGITRDITRDYMARQYYQQELSYLFELPADTYAVSYIDVDSWRIVSQRRQLIKDHTYQSCFTVERLCEAALESIVDKKSEVADFYRSFTSQKLRDIFKSGKTTLSFKYQRRLADNVIRWVRDNVRFLVDAESGHLCVMLTARDIEKEKQEEQKLVTAATMDKMTMILNRETTMERIREILKNEPQERHVLYMLDVDNFKVLNDTLGHQEGDSFLISLASVIKKNFRESDVVGRIGGDEFFVFMRRAPEQKRIIEKTREFLKSTHKVCESYKELGVSVSIGVSCYPDDGTTLDELYAKSDDALYRAKKKGKNQVIFSE